MGDKEITTTKEAMADAAKLLEKFPDATAAELFDVLSNAGATPEEQAELIEATRKDLELLYGEPDEADDAKDKKAAKPTATEGDLDELVGKRKGNADWEPVEPEPMSETHPEVAAVLQKMQDREDELDEGGDHEGAEFDDANAVNVRKAIKNATAMMRERGLTDY